ncbi:hypothetical protein [Brevibacillus migulae]|uniref:hypothetical protein n=1 Tax=Brevibacillus migulae TaxID=1644114 RepID=UPI00106E59AD|nr:hypothetical protein [Brevibacillus migulae]
MASSRENPANIDAYTRATFQAFVDALIPATPDLTATGVTFGAESAGALELLVHEFVIQELNFSVSPLAGQTLLDTSPATGAAQLLDAAAVQLIQSGEAREPLDVYAFPGGGSFSALSRRDRLRAVDKLSMLDIDLESLPPPYTNNSAFVENVTVMFNLLAMFGFYSEWSGYGTTRFFSPDERKVECFPLSWIQTGYPGRSLGYRALRGYLLEFPPKEEQKR